MSALLVDMSRRSAFAAATPTVESLERGNPAGFVHALAGTRIGKTFNFYRDGARAELRRERLASYLEARAGARILLVGEAAGYRGARVSGVPFTSERQLSGRGPAEATATVVHQVLAELGLEDEVLLWNLVPTHPHRDGEPRSNRPPTRREIAAGRLFLDALRRGRTVIPVGRLAHAHLGGPYVRHPSHGGAADFRSALTAEIEAKDESLEVTGRGTRATLPRRSSSLRGRARG